jgi:hypothetical protein
MIIYSSILKSLVRASFQAVQDHNYDEVLKGVSSKNLTHRFAGPNSLGGIRHDKVALEKWFRRVGTVLPELRFEIKDVLVIGGPWNTTVVARWVARCNLENGESYCKSWCAHY